MATLRSFIHASKPATLRAWILAAAKDLPAFESWIQERRDLEEHNTDGLLARVQKQIATMALVPGITDGWGRHLAAGETDWAAIERALEAALAAGLHDEILEVVPDMLAAGVERCEADMHDDGVSYPISECLAIAVGALASCSLTNAERILCLFDMGLSDPYDFLPSFDKLLRGCPKADWSAAADEWAARVGRQGEKELSRPRIAECRKVLEILLVRAGRGAETEAIWVGAARSGGSALPLIRRYLDEQRWAEAERETLLALEAKNAQERNEREAGELHEQLLRAAEGAQEWKKLAALHAEAFRAAPAAGRYEGLCQAARKAGRLGGVRKGVRAFLEGSESDLAPHQRDWGLPKVAGPARREPAAGPHTEVRLEVALLDGTPREVLRCHAALTAHPPYRYAARGRDVAVSKAVSKTHPTEALALYAAHVDHLLKRAKPDLYEEVVELVRAMRPLDTRVGPTGAWQRRVAQLRADHARKSRLTKLLDKLPGTGAARS